MSDTLTGVCLDGPMQGKRLSYDGSIYRVALNPSNYKVIPYSMVKKVEQNILVGAYAWCEERQVWVWVGS